MKRHQWYQIYRFGHGRPALMSIWGTHGQGRDFQRLERIEADRVGWGWKQEEEGGWYGVVMVGVSVKNEGWMDECIVEWEQG